MPHARAFREVFVMSSIRTRARTRLHYAAAVGLLAGVAVFATATPASAHDSLLTSTPAAGERLELAPSEVSLTFSDDVLALGAAIIVTGEDSRDWALPDPVIVDDTVTAALSPGMPDASYELRWRVVSADGHPISGVIPFTVGDGSPSVPTPEPEVQQTVAPGAGLGPGAGIQTTPCSDDASDILRSVAIGIGGAVLALGLAMGIQTIRRRARHKAAAATTTHIDPDDASGSHLS